MEKETKFFVVKYTCDGLTPEGENKKCKAQYLVKASTFTEAETIMNNVLSDETNFDITAITISKAEEIVRRKDRSLKDDDHYFLLTSSFITLDETSGKEKKMSMQYYVVGNTISEAQDIFSDYMKDAIFDWKIDKVEITPIFYDSENDQ